MTAFGDWLVVTGELVVEVDPDRTGDVPGLVRRSAVATIEVPAHIGKHGIGVISNGSTSVDGLAALSTQWQFAEKAAAEHGMTVDRRHWRVLMSWHIAESRTKAVEESWEGLGRWHNEYQVRVLARPGAEHVRDVRAMAEEMAGGAASGGNVGVIGTPDDVVAKIHELQEVSGGFGVASVEVFAAP